MKAVPFLRNRSIRRKAKKASLADLKTRFLELQELRQKVRFAECGRVAAAAPDGASLRNSHANTARGREPEAGSH
jgi:hypothetical protein